jgi:hypothetical protein
MFGRRPKARCGRLLSSVTPTRAIACVATLVAAVCQCGCGSSVRDATRASAGRPSGGPRASARRALATNAPPQAHTSSALPPAAGTPARHRSRAAAPPRSRRSGRSHSIPATAAPPRAARYTAGRATFKALVNGECAAATVGAAGSPQSQPVPRGARELQSQQTSRPGEPPARASAAEYAPIERKLAALQRAVVPATSKPSVERLVGALEQLGGLYLAEGQASQPPPPGAVGAVEAQALAAALAAGVPACAPAHAKLAGATQQTAPAASK